MLEHLGARVCYYLNSCGVITWHCGTDIQLRASFFCDISSGVPVLCKVLLADCLNRKCLSWIVLGTFPMYLQLALYYSELPLCLDIINRAFLVR